MNKSFITNIVAIQNAIANQKLVVFAGAGISIDAGVPLWGSLIEELKNEMDIPNNITDYLQIAQMYFNERKQKEYIEKIRKVLKHKKIRYNEIHESIFELNPEHILTTNFDDLLEQVIKAKAYPFSVIKRDKDFPYVKNTNLLVKVHGDLDETDLVLKEDDFVEYEQNHPLTSAFIRSTFANKIVLFIGYSFSDIDLKIIVQNVKNILGQDFQHAYLLEMFPMHPTQRKYLENKGITVISYHDANKDDNSNYIEKYLKGENVFKESFYKKANNISEIGQKLLDMIQFILHYDKFNDTLSKKNIIEQMYESLERFSEMPILPKEFIAKLYPFKTQNRYEAIRNGEYIMKIQNPKIERLFFDFMKKEEDGSWQLICEPDSKMTTDEAKLIIESLHYSENIDNELDKQVKELHKKYGKKIDKIFTRLNHASIFYLKDANNRIIATNWHVKEQCSCVNCKISRMELESVVSNMLSKEITETSDTADDLELAFTHYKLGNYLNAWNMFDVIGNKSWQLGKFIHYFIAKSNQVYLRNLVQEYYWLNGSKDIEKMKSILDKISEINLDKILLQLFNTNQLEYELLSYIKNQNILLTVEEAINTKRKDIEEIYDLYKNGGSSHGDYPYNSIHINFTILPYFYNRNFIVYDAFSDFHRIIQNGIEALLICYAIDKSYKGRLKDFSSIHFQLIMEYCDTKELEKVCRKYKIENLEMLEEEKAEIFKFIINYFQSLSTQSVLNHLDNYSFERKLVRTFNGISFLLSKVRFEKKEYSHLAKHFIQFADNFLLKRCNDDLYFKALEYNYQLFDNSHLTSFLKLVFKNGFDSHFIRNAIITISNIIFAGKSEKISDKELIAKMKDYIWLEPKRFSDLPTIFSNIVCDSEKEFFRGEVINKVNTNFNSFIDVYWYFSINKKIDYTIFFNQYVDYINKQCTFSDEDVIKASLNLYPNSNLNFFEPTDLFINLFRFIRCLDISLENEELACINRDCNFKYFLLSPFSFDYNNFRIEWFHFFSDKEVYEFWAKIPQIKEQLTLSLKEKPNEKLGEIYLKYFI